MAVVLTRKKSGIGKPIGLACALKPRASRGFRLTTFWEPARREAYIIGFAHGARFGYSWALVHIGGVDSRQQQGRGRHEIF